MSNPLSLMSLMDNRDGTFPLIRIKFTSMINPSPQKGIWMRSVPIESCWPPIPVTDLRSFFMIIGFRPKVEQYDLYWSSYITDMLAHVYILTPEKRCSVSSMRLKCIVKSMSYLSA